MEILRYKYIFVIITAIQSCSGNNHEDRPPNGTTANCPFSKIIEDLLKSHNKTTDRSIYTKDRDRVKLFLSSLAHINEHEDKNNDELVDEIIASINRIKNNVPNATDRLNEAIILSSPQAEVSKTMQKVNQIKSGIEEKIDTIKHYDTDKKSSVDNVNKPDEVTTEKTKFVEVLTIEPNNTSVSSKNTSHNIIEVLKHLMPLFNSTLTKQLHNITLIDEDDSDISIAGTKNVSTIVVTYCDKDNLTKINSTVALGKETDFKTDLDYDYYNDEDNLETDENDEKPSPNMTIGEKRALLEAAEYGVQKMHELYSVLEPKLYSLGFWLDDSNPARYVAAFNAPSDEAIKYSRYGYATLQAASRLKQLARGNDDGVEGRTEETQFPTASALRQSPLMQHCPLRGAPKCPPASKRYRTHDGTCNNLNRPRWGATMTAVQRFLSPSYSDGIQAPRRSIFGSKLPSAREISVGIHQDQSAETSGVTHLLMQWGQFVDHDVVSSSQTRGFNGSVPSCCKNGGRDFVPREFLHPECFPIAVPTSDPFYGPRGIRCLDFIRSSPAPRDDCALGWREQLNQVSAYLDASPLYASSVTKSDKLRLFRNGMLQYGRLQQRRPVLPPERRDELCRGGAVSTDCFKSGDARVNEHPGLVAAHIVWLRQHNRMAQELAHLNPHWSDEKIYQETRKIVGAMVQHITYREFLPIILGPEVMSRFELELQKKGYYKDYNPKVNPSPASAFGSAAFRFGHSLVQSSMVRYDRFHRPMKNNVSLHNEITNPSNLWSMGAVDRLLLGMVNQPIQKRDEFITEELTNHLFQTPQVDFGMDLAAINIQRGRDHGVSPYTTWREPCGLSEILDFDDLLRVMPARAAKKMKELYRHVDDIDLFTGGMAERPVVGGLVGPTFACIIAQQFSNFKKGDRFWYENGGFDSSFTPAQLQQIRRISFAQVLCRTLDTIDTIQPFVFLSPDNPDNDRISCQNGLLNNFDLSPWIELGSEFDNDVSKSDKVKGPDVTTTTQQPKKTKPTSTTPKTTRKPPRVTIKPNRNDNNDTMTSIKNTTNNLTDKLNMTKKAKDNDNDPPVTNDTTRPNMTVKIDDKLDFKNKSKRLEDSTADLRQRPTIYDEYDYDDDEDIQSVQSVVVNNVAHNRPYKRPVITVTENVNKYTYLINYVPRPTTESWRLTTRRAPWRQTTKRNEDRDVVKVTYQTYDDTYRRPTKPYYHQRPDNQNYRHNRPTYTPKEADSSGRSNDQKTETTTKPTSTTDKAHVKTEEPSTENLYKLVTFGYVGTYRGDKSGQELKNKITDKTENLKENSTPISKEFLTHDNKNEDQAMKLSTFFMYDTATRPYNMDRPTRRHDEDTPKRVDKYYYIRNVLHKYDADTTVTKIPPTKEQDTVRETYNNPGNPTMKIEERSSAMAALEDVEVNAKNKNRLKPKPSGVKKPQTPAKTPSVAFQVMPSEISPSQWAEYEERAELPDTLLQKMPIMKTDPYALKEIPRPINIRRRRPNTGRH